MSIRLKYLYIHISIYVYMYIYICCRFKRKTEAQGNLSLTRFPFAHRANGSLLVVHLLTNKQTEVIHLQTD
jgi:hypothetical protein